LDHRDQEIFNLKNQNEDQSNVISRLQTEKSNLEKNVIISINLIYNLYNRIMN